MPGSPAPARLAPRSRGPEYRGGRPSHHLLICAHGDECSSPGSAEAGVNQPRAQGDAARVRPARAAAGLAWSCRPAVASLSARSAPRRWPAGGGARCGQEPIHQVAQGNRGDPAAGGPALAPGVDQIRVIRAEVGDARAEEGVGIGEAPTVCRALQIEVHRARAPRRGKLPSERRLSDLTRADEDHRRHEPEAILDEMGGPARDQHNTGILSRRVRNPASRAARPAEAWRACRYPAGSLALPAAAVETSEIAKTRTGASRPRRC